MCQPFAVEDFGGNVMKKHNVNYIRLPLFCFIFVIFILAFTIPAFKSADLAYAQGSFENSTTPTPTRTPTPTMASQYIEPTPASTKVPQKTVPPEPRKPLLEYKDIIMIPGTMPVSLEVLEAVAKILADSKDVSGQADYFA